MTISKGFLLLLALVESGNRDVPAYTGDAKGPFQISPVCLREANRILYQQDRRLGPAFYEPNDVHDYHMSRSIAFVCLDYWKPILERRHKCKWTEYDALAFWLYGPGQWSPKSKLTHESRRRNKRYEIYKERGAK